MTDDIKCPKCGYEFEDSCDFITYDGGNGPQDAQCPACEAKLTIEETVVRTFEVAERKDQ